MPSCVSPLTATTQCLLLVAFARNSETKPVPYPSLDPEFLSQWIGRSEEHRDRLSPRQARLMQTTLERPASLAEGDPLPPLWHWLYFPVEVPLSGLGREGHPQLGGFLPPVALPRRMWAGGRYAFHAPLPLGADVQRRSTIKTVSVKEGRSGPLCFVTVGHSFSIANRTCLVEEHDIVYRDDPKPGAPPPKPQPAPQDCYWQRRVEPSPIQLFRYSALTFNAHRIHYDRDYCRDVEGYPGLVFHGPLTGTLLADLAASAAGRQLASFSFRAVAPLFDTAPFTIHGKPSQGGASLWAATADGGLAMTAEASFASGYSRGG